jgi:hypothetical protein
LKTTAPDVLNDPNKDFSHHSCNQNRVSIGFGCSGMKNILSARDFARLVDDICISEVNCSRNGIGMVKTVPTDGNSKVGDFGNDDFPPADYERTTQTVVMNLFENAFDDEWTASEPDPLVCTTIIDHVINLCDFPADSIMVKFIDQQQWSTLEHEISVGLDEVGEFFTASDDGITFEDPPMLIHLRSFKTFLLYYRSKICWGETPT